MKKEKVIKKKINESTLRNIIYKKVLEELNLKEYRGDDYVFGNDGDIKYIRQNGKSNAGTGLDYYHPFKGGKRTAGNIKVVGSDGNEFTGSIYEPSTYSSGKGHMLYKVLRAIDNILFGNDKVEWTESEKEEIENIKALIGKLAIKTKEEGNKKRGYNGPEEPNEEEPEEL